MANARTFVEFDVPITAREKYWLLIPAADVARVEDMSNDELAEYINEHGADWDYRGVHSSEMDENGEPEGMEIFEEVYGLPSGSKP